MPDFDFTLDEPLHVGIVVDDRLWLQRPGAIARVRANDLRGVAQQAQAVREERPGVPVLVDIQVMIAADSPTARAAMNLVAPFTNDTLLYIGTPAGLIGLVTDIHALGIADGAVFIPLHNGPVLDLIRLQVLPALEAIAADPSEAQPA